MATVCHLSRLWVAVIKLKFISMLSFFILRNKRMTIIDCAAIYTIAMFIGGLASSVEFESDRYIIPDHSINIVE